MAQTSGLLSGHRNRTSPFSDLDAMTKTSEGLNRPKLSKNKSGSYDGIERHPETHTEHRSVKYESDFDIRRSRPTYQDTHLKASMMAYSDHARQVQYKRGLILEKPSHYYQEVLKVHARHIPKIKNEKKRRRGSFSWPESQADFQTDVSESRDKTNSILPSVHWDPNPKEMPLKFASVSDLDELRQNLKTKYKQSRNVNPASKLSNDKRLTVQDMKQETHPVSESNQNGLLRQRTNRRTLPKRKPQEKESPKGYQHHDVRLGISRVYQSEEEFEEDRMNVLKDALNILNGIERNGPKGSPLHTKSTIKMKKIKRIRFKRRALSIIPEGRDSVEDDDTDYQEDDNDDDRNDTHDQYVTSSDHFRTERSVSLMHSEGIQQITQNEQNSYETSLNSYHKDHSTKSLHTETSKSRYEHLSHLELVQQKRHKARQALLVGEEHSMPQYDKVKQVKDLQNYAKSKKKQHKFKFLKE